jgi:PKD repeat protein
VGNGNLVQPLADDLAGARYGYGPYGRPSYGFHDVYANTYRVESSVQTGVISGPSIAYRGHPARFQFTLGNRGSVSEGSVRAQFYLSTDRFITTSDTYLGAATFSLGDGSWGTYTATVTVPLGLTPSFYYFGTVVDPLGSIAESDENNNAVAVFTGTTVPDYSPPLPCLTATPTFGPAPLDVQLNAACSSDPDGFIATYRWNFGDGGQVDGPAVVNHQYATPGSYTVTLTLIDNMGLTSTTTQNILVVDPSGCLICG